MNIIKILCLSLLFSSLLGCAALQQAYIEQACSSSAAYATGMNDARNGQEMQSNYAENCPTNNDVFNLAYQKGYTFGLSSNSNNSNSLAGGTTNIGGTQINVYAGRFPNNSPLTPLKQCVTNQFGDKACGYNCAKSSFGVKCAPNPSQNCVANTYGDIKCGNNCSVDQFQTIHCN